MADGDSHDLTGGVTTPRPDPTQLTDAAIARLERSMTLWVEGQLAIRDERLRGIDTATNLRLTGMSGISGDVDSKVGRLEDVMAEKFSSVSQRFDERDTRSERESRDNKVAVDAAFAAQKEAAAKQDEANAKAIDKSERATAETIKTNQELNQAKTDALTSGLDDIKLELRGITANKLGQTEQRVVTTENRTSTYATIGVIISIVLFGFALIAFLASQVAS
jgi:hypothetical protein